MHETLGRCVCRVDQLYAFFLQWSPDIYDNDEELDADAQGFVVVEHDSIDIVDNHFQPAHRLSQSWKVSYVTHTHIVCLDGAGCRADETADVG